MALAIAAMAAVTLMDFFSRASFSGQRIEMETAARALSRALLSEGNIGSGQAGPLHWTARLDEAGSGLALHQIQINWQGRAILILGRMETATAGAWER